MIDKIKVEKAISDLLIGLGEDITRPGIYETPQRVARMYEEILSGMNSDPMKYLKFFSEDINNSETILVKDIPLYSVCEHHLLPFIGKVNIAYIPQNNKIIGLSKLSRIVNCFAKRLQVQERLTNQIARFIYENISSSGVVVIIEAEHLCMTMRGTKAFGSTTKTSAFYGVFSEDSARKLEVLKMIEERG